MIDSELFVFNFVQLIIFVVFYNHSKKRVTLVKMLIPALRPRSVLGTGASRPDVMVIRVSVCILKYCEILFNNDV